MKKITLLLISLVFTIGVFAYLTIHHYEVKSGLGNGDSICSISSKINCDAAAASSYSEILRIPVAVLGGIFHLVLFGFILFYKLGWNDESPYLKATIRFQLAFAAAVSVGMALISIFMVGAACPFCIAGYILSFLNLYLGWNLISDTQEAFDINGYFGPYKSHLIMLAVVPAFSWVVSTMASEHYGLQDITKYIPEKIAIWKAGTEYAFEPQLGISNGVENAKYTLVEFADFKCPHCKHASNTIGLFLKGRPDVKFIFKPYPLDGSCNTAVQSKGDGSRCQFAAYALCAQKLAGKGLEVTHWLFDNQEKFFEISDGKSLLPQLQEKFSLDSKTMSECADSAETYDLINRSAKEGVAAQVEGTPTIYLNGKKLPWGHIPDVLRTATSM